MYNYGHNLDPRQLFHWSAAPFSPYFPEGEEEREVQCQGEGEGPHHYLEGEAAEEEEEEEEGEAPGQPEDNWFHS